MDDHFVIGRQLGLFLRLVERMYADLKVEKLDLDRAAYLLLGRIAGEGPARLTKLADDLCLDLSTVSRQVAALEAAGLVTRTTDSSDRRASVIEATETGYETFARNREVWLSSMRDLLADWTQGERAEFAQLLVRLNKKISVRLSEKHEGRGCGPEGRHHAAEARSKDASGNDASNKNGTTKDASRTDPNTKDASGKEVSGKDTSNKDASNKDVKNKDDSSKHSTRESS